MLGLDLKKLKILFQVGFEKNSFAQKKTSPTFHLLEK